MSSQKQPLGSIVWTDLTVSDAENIRDFYAQVIGWKSQEHDMGDYNDYVIQTADEGQTVAGICHARGSNVDIPPQWLIYVTVADVQAAANKCISLGGKVLDEPRKWANKIFVLFKTRRVRLWL